MKVALSKFAVSLAVLMPLFASSAFALEVDVKKARADAARGLGPSHVVLIPGESIVADKRTFHCIGYEPGQWGMMPKPPVGSRLRCQDDGKFTSPDFKVQDGNSLVSKF
jgi:hypothetical protein